MPCWRTLCLLRLQNWFSSCPFPLDRCTGTASAGTEARVSVPQVLLCASNQNSSIVECWSLRKEGLPVNNIFQQISPVGEFQHLVLLKVGAWCERKSSAGSQTHYHVDGIIRSPVFIFQVFLVMFCSIRLHLRQQIAGFQEVVQLLLSLSKTLSVLLRNHSSC